VLGRLFTNYSRGIYPQAGGRDSLLSWRVAQEAMHQTADDLKGIGCDTVSLSNFQGRRALGGLLLRNYNGRFVTPAAKHIDSTAFPLFRHKVGIRDGPDF
jgi:hypothetical protein